MLLYININIMQQEKRRVFRTYRYIFAILKITIRKSENFRKIFKDVFFCPGVYIMQSSTVVWGRGVATVKIMIFKNY